VKIFKQIQEFNQPNTFVTIGTFDGVHLGHRKLLAHLKLRASEHQSQASVLTFWPHPKMVLSPTSNDLKLLNTIEERTELLKQTGIDNLIIMPFTKDFSKYEASFFIEEILVKQLKIKGLIIGYDHHFGYKRKGSVNCIAQQALKHHFFLEQIEAFSHNQINVSSTKIRSALMQGDIPLAGKYLSYNYMITGKVIAGKQIGRTIGFPTANILVEERYKLIPDFGVYATEIKLDNRILFGMVNIGYKPTVSQKNEIAIEVNIFNFNENIYNKQITLFLIEKIRNEKKFENLLQLQNQIHFDKIQIEQIIEKYNIPLR